MTGNALLPAPLGMLMLLERRLKSACDRLSLDICSVMRSVAALSFKIDTALCVCVCVCVCVYHELVLRARENSRGVGHSNEISAICFKKLVTFPQTTCTKRRVFN